MVTQLDTDNDETIVTSSSLFQTSFWKWFKLAFGSWAVIQLVFSLMWQSHSLGEVIRRFFGWNHLGPCVFVGLFAAIYDVAKRYSNKNQEVVKRGSHLSAASFSASLLILASGLKYWREIFVGYLISRFIGAITENFRHSTPCMPLVERSLKNTMPPLAILGLAAIKTVRGQAPLMWVITQQKRLFKVIAD